MKDIYVGLSARRKKDAASHNILVNLRLTGLSFSGIHQITPGVAVAFAEVAHSTAGCSLVSPDFEGSGAPFWFVAAQKRRLAAARFAAVAALFFVAARIVSGHRFRIWPR